MNQSKLEVAGKQTCLSYLLHVTPERRPTILSYIRIRTVDLTPCPVSPQEKRHRLNPTPVIGLQNSDRRGGLEHVEPVRRGAHYHPRDLGVEVQLLDVRLPLVNEQQLRGEVLQPLRPLRPRRARRRLVVGFHGQIPHRQLVVRARGGEHGLVRRVPLDRRNRSLSENWGMEGGGVDGGLVWWCAGG